jgi:dihydrolipoamide dehydrogenase
LAIAIEATIDEVIATIHAHPTVAESIKEAALAVEKRAIHVPNR